MITRIIHNYATAGLAFTFIAAQISDAFGPISRSSTRQFTRRRTIILSTSFFCCLTFGARAIELVTHSKNVQDEVLVYSLSQILLQTTIFLTLLASSGPSPYPYLTTWSLTLLVEIALLSSRITHGSDINKVFFSLASFQVGIISILAIATAASLLSASHASDTLKRKFSPPRKPTGSSETTSLIDASSQHSTEYPDDPHTEQFAQMEEDSDDDEDFEDDNNSVKAIRAQKLQQPGGFLSYCASWKLLIPYMIPTKNLKLQFYMALLISNTLIQRALNLLGPYLLGRIVDKLTTTHKFPVVEIVSYVLIVVLISDMCGLTGLNDSLFTRIGAWSRQSLVIAAFDKIMSLSADFHDSKDSGEVIKAVEQAESLHELFVIFVEDLVPGVLDSIIALYYVNYLLDIYATLIVLAVGIGFSFSTIFAARPLVTTRRIAAAAERHQSEMLYEAVGNWAIVSYFNRKAFEIARISKAAHHVAVTDVRNNDYKIIMFASQEIVERLGLISILLLAAFRIVRGTSSIGTFITVERYWSVLQQPLYNLGHTYRALASHLIDAERLLQLFETEITVNDRPGAVPLQLKDGKIEFQNVEFTYGTDRTVIQDMSFTIQPGQTVALVGATGGGKSTITKLLMRFYDVNDGQILIDDQDISTVTQDSLRSCFGFVPQDSVLFNTTVLENVRYGRLDATDEEVYNACKGACIHDRIMSLPSGYHTRVGERGVKMSGGERQRIAIARVLLKHPWIVVLDEATSAMDSQTESEIQKALKNLTKGRSAIIVAHRLSTIVDADFIFVIDQGQIVEQGSHEELLQRCGRYSQLWEKQISSEVGPDLSLDRLVDLQPRSH